jgi:hypothetical protein
MVPALSGSQMKKQIVHVSVLQTSKVAAALYFVMSLPFVLIMMIPVMLAGSSMPGLSVGMLIAMPIIYLIFGFIFTAVAAWIYNIVAKVVGGFEFSVNEVPGA